MNVRPGGAGVDRPGGLYCRVAVLLGCGAAALWGGPSPHAAVTRQVPEQTFIRTEPNPRFATALYVPRAAAPPAAAGSTAADPAASPVIFYSGEWGWRPLQQDTASYLASTGRFVLGIDAVEYFKAIFPDQAMAEDFGRFRSFVNERAGRPKDGGVILVGFAAGAEIIPYLVNRVGPRGVRGMVLIAPNTKGAKVFRVAIQLRMPSPAGEEFDVAGELRRMAPLPVVLMEGTLDAHSEAKALSEAPRGPTKYAPVVGGDRQFHEVRDGFFTLLAEALRWIDGGPARPAAPGATEPGSAPPPAVPVPQGASGPTRPPGPIRPPAAGPTPPERQSPRAGALP